MILDLDLIFASKIIAKARLKMSQSLLIKYFLFWWKITKLIVQIYFKERYLSRYPNLNKFKRRDQKDLREKIKLQRSMSKDLKSEVEMYGYYIKKD